MRAKGKIVAAIVVFGPFLTSTVSATDYYVSTCGNDSWSGTSATCSSPDGPKLTLQEGMDLGEDGDVIHVAAGTYSGAGNVNLTFPDDPVSGVASKMTVICDGTMGSCIIDAEGYTQQNPCNSSSTDVRGFTFNNDGATNACIVDGFTIKNGCQYGSTSDQYGGGILIKLSMPTIRKCIVTDNRAQWGGGGTIRDRHLFSGVAGDGSHVHTCVANSSWGLITALRLSISGMEPATSFHGNKLSSRRIPVSAAPAVEARSAPRRIAGSIRDR